MPKTSCYPLRWILQFTGYRVDDACPAVHMSVRTHLMNYDLHQNIALPVNLKGSELVLGQSRVRLKSLHAVLILLRLKMLVHSVCAAIIANRRDSPRINNVSRRRLSREARMPHDETDRNSTAGGVLDMMENLNMATAAAYIVDSIADV